MDGYTRALTRGEKAGGRVLKCPFFLKKIVKVVKNARTNIHNQSQIKEW